MFIRYRFEYFITQEMSRFNFMRNKDEKRIYKINNRGNLRKNCSFANVVLQMESKYKQRLSCYYTPMRWSYGFWRREQLHLSPDIHIFHHVLDTEALAGDLPHENSTTVRMIVK